MISSTALELVTCCQYVTGVWPSTDLNFASSAEFAGSFWLWRIAKLVMASITSRAHMIASIGRLKRGSMRSVSQFVAGIRSGKVGKRMSTGELKEWSFPKQVNHSFALILLPCLHIPTIWATGTNISVSGAVDGRTNEAQPQPDRLELADEVNLPLLCRSALEAENLGAPCYAATTSCESKPTTNTIVALNRRSHPSDFRVPFS